MLVRGPDAVPTYCYAPASEARIARVKRMESLCAEHDISLAAAALQFSTRDPRVTSTIVGMSEPRRVDQTVALLETPIPDALWDELLPLTDASGD